MKQEKTKQAKAAEKRRKKALWERRKAERKMKGRQQL